VTERLAARDDAVDSLVEHAPCGFVSFTDDGTIRTANAMLRQMLDLTREDLTGARIETILNVGSRIFYQTHFFPLLKLHGKAEEIFLLLRARSGEAVATLCNAVRRKRGDEWLTDCVLMRVSERQKFEDALLRAKKEAEAANEQLERQALELELSEQQLLEQGQELERQRAVAEEANRAKSAFLATMSHELRTPLNAIGGYVQLIELGIHGPVTDAQAEALARIARSQRHLLRLINDVLNLARIEAGRVEYVLAPCRLQEIVDAVLPMVEPQLLARRIGYRVEIATDLSAHADKEKVQQILLNLLSNATKFTPANGSVAIHGFADAERADRVHLRVRDTGVGIPAERLSHVFEPFVQVDDSQARRSEGTGLGLAISRDLARGMGGELTAESQLGVGSSFTLTLPSAPPSSATAGTTR
jgi:signal transduction histidine kinase